MKFISPSRTIQTAIAIAINSQFRILLDPREILLKICYPKYDAHYTSAIALTIANRLNLNPLEIAAAIAQTCSQNPEISAQSQIQAFGKGWLNISLSKKYISKSLFDLENWQIEGITSFDGFWQKCDISINPANNPPETIVQYAYARCCALIRLAQRLNVVAIHELPLHYFDEEVSLLLGNLEIADYLENENILPLNRQKLLRSLAEAFLHFYDRCCIFGVAPEIAYRRLLLIRVTQKMLIAIAPPEINYAMYL
jgi:arginyl-tRNA synthetase